MSFAPFDTSLIVERLVTQLPALHFVGGAADYAAVKELRGFRTPSAYVIFAEENNSGKLPTSSLPATTALPAMLMARAKYIHASHCLLRAVSCTASVRPVAIFCEYPRRLPISVSPFQRHIGF